MKIVYSYYVLDIVHKGHLVMMENAKALAGEDGRLIVGILTDAAVMEKKRKPMKTRSKKRVGNWCPAQAPTGARIMEEIIMGSPSRMSRRFSLKLE